MTFLVSSRRRRAGVQRGGFTATGGAGHQDHTVRAVQHRLELLLRLSGESETTQIGNQRTAVQQTQHDFLAMQTGESGNAEIEGAIAKMRPESPVLRHSGFRDVESRQDFKTRSDGQDKVAGQ